MKPLPGTIKTTRQNIIPHHAETPGGGIACGKCLKRFKSWLRLKKHKADEHGEINEFSRYSTNTLSKTNRESQRKERLHASEEALKEEISKLRATR